MSGVHVVSSADEWSQSAADLVKTAFEGPTVKVCEDLITRLDAVSPLSSATALLDNGCGVGQVIGRLLTSFSDRVGAGTRLVASDISAGMVSELSKRRAEEVLVLSSSSDSDNDGAATHRAKLWQALETHVWDAQALTDVPADAFSHVTAGLLYMMLPDWRAALAETRRVLRPGGVLALSSFGRISWMELMGLFAQVRPGLAGPQVPAVWATKEGIQGELTAAGFEDVEVVECHTYMQFEDSRTLVEGLMRIIPSAKNLTADLTQDEVGRGIELMVRHLDENYAEAPRRLPAVALIATGRKARE